MRIEQDLLYIQYDNLNNNRDIMYHRVLHSVENNYDENAQFKKTLRKTLSISVILYVFPRVLPIIIRNCYV